MKRKLNDDSRPCGAQVRAQRKFAQGVLLHGSSTSHVLNKRSPAFSTPSPPPPVTPKPKTEDFINFLCYRGTPVLPPCLTFFNYASLRGEDVKSRRINEQEAKFAMTALKLKYQEKRLSIVSTLARKVKERRVILTRSRGVNPDENILPKAKEKSEKKSPESEQPHARNAPSPDIIDGVPHQDPPKHDHVAAAESSNSKKPKHSPEPQESRLNKTEKLVTEKRAAAKPKSLPPRITTRALRKENASPLHELPMIKKSLPKPAKNERKKAEEKNKVDKVEKYSRPTRKTKETATIYLGLINKEFSSDDEMPNMDHAESDSSSNSSSSETKFLEKQYNASLKRDETSRLQKIQKHKKPPVKQKKTKVKPAKPEKRILRSHSHSLVLSSERNGTKRKGGSENEAIDSRRHVGAARKSVTGLRGKSSKSDSSSSESSDSESKEDEEEEEDSQDEESNVSVKNGAKEDSSESEEEEEETKEGSAIDSNVEEEEEDDDQVKANGSSVESNDEDDSKEEEKEEEEASTVESNDEEDETKEEDSVVESNDDKSSESESETEEIPTITESEINATQTDELNQTEEKDDEEDEEIEEHTQGTQMEEKKLDESYSDGDTSKDVVVEKVSIAIQVDMDLDEEAEPEVVPYREPSTHSLEHINMFNQMNLEQSNQQQQQQRQEPERVLHIPRPILPPPPPIPPPIPPQIPTVTSTTIVNGILQQHSISSNIVEPPTVLSFNSMTSFSPYAISHPMLPFGCVTESSSSSLDTHIRTVAANLDIRLVRPSMAPNNNLSPFPFQTSTLPIPFGKPMSLMPETPMPFFPTFRVPFTTTCTPRPYTPLTTQYHTMQTSAAAAVHSQMGMSMPPQQQPSASSSRMVHSQGQDLSLIQNLPNVSIVPRFDRNSSKVVILPNRKSGLHQPSGSNLVEPGSSSGSNNNEPEKTKKKGGRKRQQTNNLPAPSSPLTVRKDSCNPATYSGSASRKNMPSSTSSSTGRKKN